MKEEINNLKKQIAELQSLMRQHDHNASNSVKLDPLNLLGFPITVVADASVAPAYANLTGQIMFQIDNNAGTAHWYLWAYLLNVKTGLNVWKSIQLT